MKNLKTTILSVFIALCCLTNGNAQEKARGKSKGKITMAGSPGAIVVFGGGTSMPSSDGKDKAFLSNSTAINADAFFSLISKPEGNFSFGLNFGGAYNFGGSGGFGAKPNPFAVTGQTSSIVSDRGGDPAQAGFRMGAGPQANFYFGKFIVSPMVLGEYFSMTQKEMSIVQTTQFNGQSYDFNMSTLPETKTSGFAVTPKLRLHYMFNNRFGLFADASYTMGPKIETTVSKLIPNGNPQTPGDTYNLQQLQTGTIVKGETKSTAYSAMGFNFGVVIGLGGNAHGDNLTNSIVKPACTCCGSKVHDRIDCPDITRCNTQTASSQVALSDDLPKAQGDIKKGWDGTVKGLFVGKNTDIMVSKNGGIEKLIEQIIKGGKGKASIYKVEDREFLQISSKDENNYYEINNNSNSTFKFINVGGVTCKVATCPNGTICKLTFFGGRERCACNNGTSTSGSGCSDVSIAHAINDFIPQLDVSALPISIEENGTTISSGSVKNIKDLVLTQFKGATIGKVELVNEVNDQFIKVELTENGNSSTLLTPLRRPFDPTNKWILIGCTGSCNGSITNCTSKNVNLLGGCNCVGDNKCFGFNVQVLGINSVITRKD
jgi:hypothetical protein